MRKDGKGRGGDEGSEEWRKEKEKGRGRGERSKGKVPFTRVIKI